MVQTELVGRRLIGIDGSDPGLQPEYQLRHMGTLRASQVRKILRWYAEMSDQTNGAPIATLVETLENPKRRFWYRMGLEAVGRLENLDELRALRSVTVLGNGEGQVFVRLDF